MKTTNPFDDLNLDVTPKAIFQAQSTDAKNTTTQQAVDILKDMVNQEYDVLKCVRQYLREKEALKDTSRIKEIVDTFNSYSKFVLQNKLDSYKTAGGQLSPVTVGMVKKFKSALPVKLDEAVKDFVVVLCD